MYPNSEEFFRNEALRHVNETAHNQEGDAGDAPAEPRLDLMRFAAFDSAGASSSRFTRPPVSRVLPFRHMIH